MNSNYMFAFNRIRPNGPPGIGSRSFVAPAPNPVPNPVPKLASNRFSINHLINYKSPGGCRSCN